MTARTLRISQPLVADLITKYDHELAHARPTYVPLNPAERLVREGELCDNPKLFQELLGSRLYLGMCTRRGHSRLTLQRTEDELLEVLIWAWQGCICYPCKQMGRAHACDTVTGVTATSLSINSLVEGGGVDW